VGFIGVRLAVDLIVYGMTEIASSLTTAEFRESRLPRRPAPQQPVAPAPLRGKAAGMREKSPK
jgi:hypothetical protein